MSWKLAAFVVVLCIPCSIVCADEETRTPYGCLYDQWEGELEALEQGAGDSNEETSELESLKNKLRARYTEKFLQLARENAGNHDILTNCMVWMFVKGYDGQHFDDAINFLQERASRLHDIHGIQFKLMLPLLIDRPSDNVDPFLRGVIAESPSDHLRSAAMVTLAARLKQRAEKKGSIQLYAKSRHLFKQLLDEYPDAQTYRGNTHEMAREMLAEINGPLALGKIAPEITDVDLDGEAFDLGDYRGRIVILCFSGHWCGPCRAMHPREREIVEEHSPEDVVLIEINSDKDPAKVAEEMERKQLSWRCIPDGQSGPLAEQWGISAWPTFYVLDRQQVIRFKATGYIGDQIEIWVERLRSESQD